MSVSDVFDPDIRLLHVLQALIYIGGDCVVAQG